MPIVGPHIGAILGTWIYLLLVEIHWQEECKDKTRITADMSADNHTFEPDDDVVERTSTDSTPHSDKKLVNNDSNTLLAFNEQPIVV